MWTFLTSMSNLASNLSQLRDFLAHLGTVKGDLADVTAPPFILAPKSTLEIPAAWASRHDLFLRPAGEPEPGRRAALVARNYVCSLKALVGEGTDEQGKKPLNPFLGEIFLGEFHGGGGGGGQGSTTTTTHLVSEQVSHHPPVTACCMYNREHGITSTGFVAQSTTFSPSSGVTIRQHGYAVIRDEKHAESHLFTLPTLLVKGLVTGQPCPELRGPCYISSSSGYLTRIDFGDGGGGHHLGLGTKHKVEAVTTEAARPGDVLQRITGQWTGKLSVSDGGQSAAAADDFHVDSVPSTKLSVRPVDEQTPWESRRAWRGVFEGIGAGNVGVVQRHKSAIEESQRRRRADEEAAGRSWPRLFFARGDRDDEAQSLLAQIPGDDAGRFDASRTAGIWKFVGPEAAEDLKSRLRYDGPGP